MVTFRIDEPRRSEVESWSFTVRESDFSDGSGDRPSRVFKQWKGIGEPPATIVWDGIGAAGEKVESAVDYPYSYELTYKNGERASAVSVLPVDVLLERDGDRFKIRVASIVFRPDGADFARLAPAIVLRNETTLGRVASILAKYSEYSVIVEGHANSVAKIQGLSADKVAIEEKAELLPLSLARASFVRDLLVSRGISAARMKVRGLGSSLPVVPFTDAVSRWKNRRVEFILEK